jgi:hypothetical protein
LGLLSWLISQLADKDNITFFLINQQEEGEKDDDDENT